MGISTSRNDQLLESWQTKPPRERAKYFTVDRGVLPPWYEKVNSDTGKRRQRQHRVAMLNQEALTTGYKSVIAALLVDITQQVTKDIDQARLKRNVQRTMREYTNLLNVYKWILTYVRDYHVRMITRMAEQKQTRRSQEPTLSEEQIMKGLVQQSDFYLSSTLYQDLMREFPFLATAILQRIIDEDSDKPFLSKQEQVKVRRFVQSLLAIPTHLPKQVKDIFLERVRPPPVAPQPAAQQQPPLRGGAAR